MNNDVVKIVFIAENRIIDTFCLPDYSNGKFYLKTTKSFADGINEILTNGCDILISGITFPKSSFNGIWNPQIFDSTCSGVDYLCQAPEEIKKIPLIIYTAKCYDESQLKLKDAGVNFKKILYWYFEFNGTNQKKLIEELNLIMSEESFR